jgi:chromate reductase, NAD(P)H dehydrogenase (quinone)
VIVSRAAIDAAFGTRLRIQHSENGKGDSSSKIPNDLSAAVLFVTPEYNRSVPGVLKNAIDIGSRPYGHSAWDGKPGAVVSVSPGAISGFGANHHLRQSLVFPNLPAMQQPEAYVGGAAGLFGKEGNLTNEATRKFLKSFIDAFARWIEIQLAR